MPPDSLASSHHIIQMTLPHISYGLLVHFCVNLGSPGKTAKKPEKLSKAEVM